MTELCAESRIFVCVTAAHTSYIFSKDTVKEGHSDRLEIIPGMLVEDRMNTYVLGHGP